MILLVLVSLLEPVEAPVEPYQINYTYSQVTYPGQLIVDNVTMIDPLGEELWTRNVNAPATVFPLADGAAMLLVERAPEAMKMELGFLDSAGRLISTHHIEHFAGPVEISANMERVLVRCAGKAMLISREGQILAAYPGAFSHLAIEATGSRVALASNNTISIYSDQDELASLGIGDPYVRDMVFSTMGTKVAVLTASSLYVWHQGADVKAFHFLPSDGSPRVVSFDSTGEEVLVVFRTRNNFKLEVWNLTDGTIRRHTQPLSSTDETVIEVLYADSGWLIHLTSGWYRFSMEEE